VLHFKLGFAWIKSAQGILQKVTRANAQLSSKKNMTLHQTVWAFCWPLLCTAQAYIQDMLGARAVFTCLCACCDSIRAVFADGIYRGRLQQWV